MQSLKSNKVFKFLASVRLAIILMILLLLAGAAGTVVESRYNASLASLLIYRSYWFEALLVLLGINIFTSTLSRYPYGKHHLGFLVTHAGLILLLIGSLMTARWGIDGQLTVTEGNANDKVFLPTLALKVADLQNGQMQTLRFTRSLKALAGDDLDFLQFPDDIKMQVARYVPFARLENGYVADAKHGTGKAVQLNIVSPMFNETLWLQASQQPELAMGPATFYLRKNVATNVSEGPGKGDDTLVVKELASGRTVASIKIGDLKKATTIANSDVTVRLLQRFEEGMVAKNTLTEGGHAGANPALRIEAKRGNERISEVVFANYPAFALNAKGVFGWRFEYHRSSVTDNPDPETGSGNIVEVTPLDDLGEKFQITLSKNQQRLLQQEVGLNEELTTPWMGIRLTVKQFLKNAAPKQIVVPVELAERSDMPPSALLIKPRGGRDEDGFWLIENSYQDVNTSTRSQRVYYGMNSFKLPFKVNLVEFKKVDYPGTSTPMSFESTVQLNDAAQQVKVSMNEPLKQAGFTLYQSSYIMQPGQPAASVFSVNRDPGRWVKYLASIVLVAGIAIFTIMRSNWYRRRHA